MSKHHWPTGTVEVNLSAAHPDYRAGDPSANRKYLRFPEIGDTQGADVARALLGDKNPAADTRRQLVAQFIRAVAIAPPGMAATFAKDDVVKRVLSTTDSAGGYTIPPGFVADLIRDAERPASLYSLVRKIPVGQTSGSVPRVLSNASVAWGTENVAIDEGDPAFAETTYTVERLSSIAKLSRELVDDSGVDIVSVVGQLFGEAIAAERDRVIAIGNGTGKPLGIYSASGITDVNVTALSFENLLALKYSVDSRYHSRPAFRWTFNSSVLRSCMQLRTDTGAPIFADAIAGEPPKILGVPFVITESFPNNYVGIGDLSYYLWFNRQGMVLERSADAGEVFQKNQVWLRVVERVDGKPSLPPTVPMARTRVLAGVE